MSKPLNEDDVVRAIDAYILSSIKALRTMENSDHDIVKGSLAALTALRFALRDGEWRPKKTNVVPLRRKS
jgi:hypothetical protein